MTGELHKCTGSESDIKNKDRDGLEFKEIQRKRKMKRKILKNRKRFIELNKIYKNNEAHERGLADFIHLFYASLPFSHTLRHCTTLQNSSPNTILLMNTKYIIWLVIKSQHAGPHETTCCNKIKHLLLILE